MTYFFIPKHHLESFTYLKSTLSLFLALTYILKVLNSPQITPKKLLIHLEVMTALRQQIVSLVCTYQISIAPVLDSKELASWVWTEQKIYLAFEESGQLNPIWNRTGATPFQDSPGQDMKR